MTESASRERSAWIWLGLVAPPVAWGLRLLLAYGADDIVCSPGSITTDVLGLTYRSFAIAESGLMLIVSVVCGAGAWATWRRLRDAPPPNRAGWMAAGGIFSSAVFSLLIVTESIPLFALPVCEASL